MEYREAKAIGDAGEWRVAERLRAYCDGNPPAGYLTNLLLSVGRMTAQLDLVLVDPYGILIVEVKVRNGRIRGTADEHKWTAVYGGATRTFQNPLEQMRSQRNSLSKAIRGAGSPIDLDLIQSLVVFVDADIDSLELDTESRRRVTTVGGLPALLKTRSMERPTALSHADVVSRYEVLRSLDRSNDAAVQSRHAEYRGGAVPAPAAAVPTPVVGGAGPRRLPTLSGNPHRPGFRTPSSELGLTARQKKGVMLGCAAMSLLLFLGCVMPWLIVTLIAGPR